ncbi:MAG: hypothetical protein IT364_07240 [Candidatus Hydrogenedentes bacterium]|nr:hypothetical protein [Candidatus Hydrogenedentota bacterium]
MNRWPGPAPALAARMSDADLARTWIAQLEDWVRTHGLSGYDRFDVREHPLIRAAQTRPLLRKISTGLTDLFPNVSRRMLGIKPQLNPKAFALVALGRLRRYQTTGDPAHLHEARGHLGWLLEHPSKGHSGLCWGYPFDVFARGLHTPKYTPVVVVSTIAGEAFHLAWRVTSEKQYLDAMCSIARFIESDIPRMEHADGLYCFAYTPGDTRRVHNANLHAAAHLVRTHAAMGASAWLDLAMPAITFTLSQQREDGAWTYGILAPGDPVEAGLLTLVDHHHTGFVLRSLAEINHVLQSRDTAAQIARGFAFYRDRLFDPDGAPRTEAGRYPIDIHACAEGILCPSVLSETEPKGLAIAAQTMRWTHAHLANQATGVPYYRKYPWFTSRLYCPRWGLAWMYYALCEYEFRTTKAQQGPVQ